MGCRRRPAFPVPPTTQYRGTDNSPISGADNSPCSRCSTVPILWGADNSLYSRCPLLLGVEVPATARILGADNNLCSGCPILPSCQVPLATVLAAVLSFLPSRWVPLATQVAGALNSQLVRCPSLPNEQVPIAAQVIYREQWGVLSGHLEFDPAPATGDWVAVWGILTPERKKLQVAF